MCDEHEQVRRAAMTMTCLLFLSLTKCALVGPLIFGRRPVEEREWPEEERGRRWTSARLSFVRRAGALVTRRRRETFRRLFAARCHRLRPSCSSLLISSLSPALARSCSISAVAAGGQVKLWPLRSGRASIRWPKVVICAARARQVRASERPSARFGQTAPECK